MANTRALITRSQATELVEFYYKSKYVLVKFQSLCNLSDIFDNTALSKKDKLIEQFFKVLQSLENCTYIREMNTMPSSYANFQVEDLPGKNTNQMLHWALDNSFINRMSAMKIKTLRLEKKEDLRDCFIDNTYCTICQQVRKDEFYSSTSYGLNLPICSECFIPSENSESGDNPKDLNYVPSDEEEVDEDNDEEYDEEDEDESDEDESDEEEEDESECDDEEDEDESDEEDDEEEDDEEDEEDDEEDEEEDDDESEEDEEEESEEEDESECDEDECYECQVYLEGWEEGWKAAMKRIRVTAQNNKLEYPSRCDTCHSFYHKLKRCGGSCGGTVKYCSEDCQQIDWYKHKKDCKKL